MSDREVVHCCPVCGSDDRVQLFESRETLHGFGGSFPEVQCRSCSLVYLGQRPRGPALRAYYPEDAYHAYGRPTAYSLFRRRDPVAAAWYLVKRSVLAHQLGYGHLGGNRLVSAIVRFPLFRPIRERAMFGLSVLLHPWVKQGAVIDVGCGAGAYLDLMRALGWSVVGVDVSARAVRHARDVLGIEAHCGELPSVGLPTDRFDAASLSHTLEHVADPIGLLSEVRRVLRPGGRLAVVVPNFESLCSREFREHWFGLDPPRHLVSFTPRSLARALEAAGLVLSELTTSSRWSYRGALYSDSRLLGDPPSAFAAGHRFPWKRRLVALSTSLRARAECALGRASGEELLAIARKPG